MKTTVDSADRIFKTEVCLCSYHRALQAVFEKKKTANAVPDSLQVVFEPNIMCVVVIIGRNKSAEYETRFISDIFDGTITINLIFPVSPLFSGKLEGKQNPNTIDILEKFESVCMCAAASDGDKIAQQDDECETTTENLQER